MGRGRAFLGCTIWGSTVLGQHCFGAALFWGSAPFWSCTILGPSPLLWSMVTPQHKGELQGRSGHELLAESRSSGEGSAQRPPKPLDPCPERAEEQSAHIKSGNLMPGWGHLPTKSVPQSPRATLFGSMLEPGPVFFPIQSLFHTPLPPSSIALFYFSHCYKAGAKRAWISTPGVELANKTRSGT